MVAADCLVDYKPSSSTKPRPVQKGKGKEKAKDWEKGERKKNKDGKGKLTEEGKSKGANNNKGCFICDGPHRGRDCPKREKLNALVATDKEKEDVGDSVWSSQINPLQLVNAIRDEKFDNRLMYVSVLMNGKIVRAMVDIGATHNFIAVGVTEKLGLELGKSGSNIKAMNSTAKQVQGMVTGVGIQLGQWQGLCTLMVVPLDDFELISGNQFFIQAKVMVMPYLAGLLIGDEDQPCFVPAVGKVGKNKRTNEQRELVSALQIESGLKRGEETYLAALVEVK